MADRLTDKMVRELAAPEPRVVKGKLAGGNVVRYDSEVKGFGVRVTSAGARAFIVNYRAAGQERRITIGSYPDWNVSGAREKARELKRRVDDGGDPMRERHLQRAAPTVADLAQLYRDVHLPRKRPSSRLNDELNLTKHIIPRLGKVRVADVRRPAIAAMHREITKVTPIAANRCIALLSKMFSVAMAEEWRADNPVKGIERNPENRRNRYLVGTEIGNLADALAAHAERTSCNALRLLLLTGARKGETLSAKWEQFDLHAGVWTKPGASTKQATEHRVPLSAAAITLLTEMQAEAEEGCPFVFPGRKTVDSKGTATWAPLTEIKRVWASVCKTAGLSGVRMHDLRHTYASLLVSSGMSLPIIGALLGHTQPGTTARYAHLMDDPLRAATERVGAIVIGAKGAGADVVPMRRGA